MKKLTTQPLYFLVLYVIVLFITAGCNAEKKKEKNDKYDRPAQAIEFQQMRTRSPLTGDDVSAKMWQAVMSAEQSKEQVRNSAARINALSWTERGSFMDGVGPSNGNTRANAGITAGRVDAIWVDLADPTGKTVWIGGNMGGLWKTTDITATPATWTLINDYFGNLVISAITQDPTNHDVMYFSTGEGYYSVGSSVGSERGIGVFKSTNHGVSWSLLPSTTGFIYSTKMICDPAGNIFLGAPGTGLMRSTNGGTSWTNITPSGLSSGITDIELSSTGRMHITTRSNQAYRYTDNPVTVTSASGWNTSATSFATGSQRMEIAVSGNVLYACPSVSNNVPSIYKSTDGGVNWVATPTIPPLTSGGANWATGQAWYALAIAIHPTDPNQVIVGGLDCNKSTDGGNTWTRISQWVGTSGQYVHADQHTSVWYDNGNKLLFGSDGGIHYTSDGGVTIRDRNSGIRLKEFYSCAIHPTATNYFLAGAQDNGTHQFNGAGLTSSVEVLGGDGAYVAIDQDEPQFQTGAFVFCNFRRSANGGASWSNNGNNNTTGLFINPYDYDNLGNRVYASYSNGSYMRWEDPHSGFTFTPIAISPLSGTQVSAARVSEFTANRVFFGTTNGRVVRVDDAHLATPSSAGILATPVGGGFLNCINLGSVEQQMVATYTNYDVQNIWVSTDGGTTWTSHDGNLPNMPVYWALFHPDDNTKMYIATETGVWETDLLNGASTVWTASAGFPTVRTTMLKYRGSDRTLLAATYGRGLWTAIVPPPTGFSFGSTSAATTVCPAPVSMNVTLPTISAGGFTNPITLSATSGVPAGTSISFGTNPVAPGSSSVVTLNNANTLAPGTYNIAIQGTATGATAQTTIITYTISANAPVISTQPASQTVCEGQNVSFSVVSTGTYQWQLSTNGGVSWSNISGQTAATFTISGVTSALNNNQYRCVVSTLCGNTNSNAAILTVSSAATISGQPAGQNVCVGGTASFTVTASGTGLTYQWESAAAGCGGAFTDIPGANTAAYSVAGVTTGMNNTAYRCKVTSSCGPTTITSSCAVLTVVSPATVSVHPVSQTICNGASAGFAVTATGTGVIYQWQVNTGSGFANITDGGFYSGTSTASLTVSAANTSLNTYQYRCLVSNTTCSASAASNAATLTVNALPAISSSPVSQTICAGSNTSFSVSATGTGLTYQWQVNTGTGFVNISNVGVYNGAATATLTITGATVSMSGGQYQCVVSGTCTPAVTSAVATLTVHAPVQITASPANVELCAGGNATFTVSGSSVPAINYQWQVSTDAGASWTNIAGANSASYTANGVIAVMSNNRYRCQLSNNTCTTPVSSAAAILTVRVVPTIGLTAAPLTSLLPGQTTTLTATPSGTTGGTISTTWTLDNNPLTVAGNTYTATVNNLGAYQAGIRETWASGLFCSALSPVVTLSANISDRLFIFPSPNDGNFTVSYYNNGNAGTQRRIVVFDSKGGRVFDKQFPISGPYTLIPVNLVQASRGIYYVSVGDAAGKKLAEGKVHVR